MKIVVDEAHRKAIADQVRLAGNHRFRKWEESSNVEDAS